MGLPDVQGNTKVIDHLVRKGDDRDTDLFALRIAGIVLAVGVFGGEIATGEDFEGLRSEPQFLVHAFIVRAG
jgi:hypothetical protein